VGLVYCCRPCWTTRATVVAGLVLDGLLSLVKVGRLDLGRRAGLGSRATVLACWTCPCWTTVIVNQGWKTLTDRLGWVHSDNPVYHY
jgi:hypothetical protein